MRFPRPLFLLLVIGSFLTAWAPTAAAQATVTHKLYDNPTAAPIGTITFSSGFPAGPTASFHVTINGVDCAGTMQLESQGEHTACWRFVGCGTSGTMCFENGPYGTIGFIQLDSGGTLWTSGP